MVSTPCSSDAGSGSGSSGDVGCGSDSNDTIVFPPRTPAPTTSDVTPTPLPSTAETPTGAPTPTPIDFVSYNESPSSPPPSLPPSLPRDSEPENAGDVDTGSRRRGDRSAANIDRTSGDGSKSGVNRNGSVVGVSRVKFNISGAADDSCGCARLYARNCMSCLESVLPSGEACVVTPLGLCMSATKAESLWSYYHSVLRSSNGGFMPNDGANFWSLNSSYCPSSDEICMRCSAQWVSNYLKFGNELSRVDSYSCTGRDGCICTAYCELRESPMVLLVDSYDTHRDTMCLAITESKPGFTLGPFSFSGVFAVLWYVSAATSVACIWMLAKGIRSRRDRRRLGELRRAHRAQLDEAQANRTLTLGGWNDYRSRLVDNEHENLGLKDIALSEAPSRAEVEEGDGYRPVSPSQQLSRQRPASRVEH